MHQCLYQDNILIGHLYLIHIYKQSALDYLGYKDGDFPVTDEHVEKIITFPCDQHLEQGQLDYIISTVAEYYEK